MGMHVVVSGNPFDGMTVWGPFKTGEDATLWADAEIDSDWWIVPLEYPVTGDPS